MEACKMFRSGLFNEAKIKFLNASAQLSEIFDQFPLYKKEIAQLEAQIFNNVVMCYDKDLNEKKMIEYASKTIERAPYLTDINILLKAYLRRGMAYYGSEKYQATADDLNRVREIDPMNKQARDTLTTCLKYIKQDTGKDYIPKVDEFELPKMESIPEPVKATPVPEPVKAAAPVKEVKIEQKAPEKPAKKIPEPEKIPKKTEATYYREDPVKKAPAPAPAKSTDHNTELFNKITEIKARGNAKFQSKKFDEAIEIFTEAEQAYN
jgi:tetratricopeptide (TPR) repeat protein